MKPLFSIVMPVLNAMPFLSRAVGSVLAQAGDDAEVIVVDGGSTDGGLEWLMSTVGVQQPTNGGVLRLVSEKDGGQSEALNKGFAMARGAWFFWVNGDDLLLPGVLDKVREHIKKNNKCQWLAGNLVYIDENDRVLRCARSGKWHDWLHKNAPVRVYGPTSIFRRELFEKAGGFDETLRYMMDTDLWLRFKALGARYERLRHYCWAFRVHKGSKTSQDLRGGGDPSVAAERSRVYAKNGLCVTRTALWRQRLWRVVNGCYVRAAWDSLIFKL